MTLNSANMKAIVKKGSTNSVENTKLNVTGVSTAVIVVEPSSLVVSIAVVVGLK